LKKGGNVKLGLGFVKEVFLSISVCGAFFLEKGKILYVKTQAFL
jgi:hypothetical protein